MSDESVVAAVSAANAKAHIEHITTQIPSRLAGSANGKRMAEYSAAALTKAGVAAQVHEMPGLVSFPEKAEMRVLAPVELSIEANTLGHSLPTLADGISGELMDVASGAFSEYEGRDATGKITLSELSYHPARHEKQRISALHGRDGLRDDELGAPGEYGGAVRLGEAGVGQSDARDLQDRDGDAALHRHRAHGGSQAARDAEERAGARVVPRQRRERLAAGADHDRRGQGPDRRLRRGRRPPGFLARPAGHRQRRRQRLHPGACPRLQPAPRQAAPRPRVAASGRGTRPAP